MRIPKRYGQSRQDNCPFCDRLGTTLNSQGVPVCTGHRKATLGEMKCICGGTLDLLKGKYGVFFSCMDCGNMNMRKALEINPQPKPVIEEKETEEMTDPAPNKKKRPTETTIRSDDPFYFS